MAHRAFRRGAGAISQKRLTSWFSFSPTVTAFSAGGGTIIVSLNAAALALRPFTVVWTRFLLGIESDQISADERQIGGFGCAVVSDQALAIGVTAVPTPITDIGSDLWFVHQLLYSSFGFITGVGFEGQMQTMYEVDSKAMRKVDIGQDLVIVGEFASGISEGFTMVAGGRMLVKVN